MAARVPFTIRILTVTNKSLHFENHIVGVSTALLHKMYYISQVYLESLKTHQKPNIFARFFYKFCFLSVIFQYLFYFKLLLVS